MSRLVPGAVLAAILLLTACGGERAGKPANYETARQFQTNFERALHCYEAPNGADCDTAINRPGSGLAILCLNVTSNGLFEAQLDDNLRGADFERFRDLCAEWQTVEQQSPSEGRATLADLSEQAASMASRFE